MSVIVIVQGKHRAGGADALAQYQQTARAVVAKHGGEVIARGSGLGKLAGERQWPVGLVVRFPDKAAVDRWYDDPDYQRALPLRGRGYEELEINVFQE